MGCPTSVGNKKYVWDKGRLVRIYDDVDENESISSEDIRFTYNAYGQRISKTYSYDPGEDYDGDFLVSSTTTYTYDNSGRLIREYCTESYYESDDQTREFIYLYDDSGMIGVMYGPDLENLQTYYYRRNLLGDVTAIYDANGNRKVEYAYDAFGNCSIVYGISHDLARRNPIRYRGYYFDRETGLYYLNARYYNPEWRRFISPDSTDYLDPESVNGLNLYAYCNNDPVNYADPSGHSLVGAFVFLAIMTLAGAAVGDIVANTVEKNTGKEISGWDRFVYIAIGASLGLIAGGGLLSLGSASYGLVMSVIKKKVITKILFNGVLVSRYAAIGFLGLNVGMFFFNVLTNSSIEMVEWTEPYNPQQPIIQ